MRNPPALGPRRVPQLFEYLREMKGERMRQGRRPDSPAPRTQAEFDRDMAIGAAWIDFRMTRS